MIRLMRYTIRKLTANDVPTGLKLCRFAGWNQSEQDWSLLLNLEPQGCFAAQVAGNVVGTVTTTRYGSELAWIGMMLVAEQNRRQGIATDLMKHAIDYLRGAGVATIMLDATPAGEPIYRRLGFRVERQFHRYSHPGLRDPTPAVSSLARDLSDVHLRIDREACGANRSGLLRRLQTNSDVIATPDGFGMRRAGAIADYLGPIVARHADSAFQIIDQLLRVNGSREVYCDLIHPEADRVAAEFGFTPIRTLSRMSLGLDDDPADASMRFAIADPALG